VNDLTGIMEKGQRGKQLLGYLLSNWNRYAQLWKQSSELGQVWTHGFKDEADMLAVGTRMSELIQETQDMVGADDVGKFLRFRFQVP
jgi:hypothetical protein